MRRRKPGVCKIFVSCRRKTRCHRKSTRSLTHVRGCFCLGGGAEGRGLGGLLNDSIHELESFRRIGWTNRLVMGYVHDAFFDSVERLTGALENGEQIFLRDGTVGGVNEIPPAADGLLHLNLCLLAYDQSVNEPVHLALDRLIRDRNFLGHGILELLLSVGVAICP